MPSRRPRRLSLAPALDGRLPGAIAHGAVWLLPLLVLEVLGRVSPVDATDAVAVLCVVALAGAAWMHFGDAVRDAWDWPRLAGLRKRLERLDLELGLDLRREPKVPFALPRAPLAVVSGLVLFALVLVFTRGFFPTRAREAIRTVSGLGYLVLLAGLWWALLGGAIAGVSLVVVDLHERLLARRRWRERADELTALVAPLVFGIVALSAGLLPRLWAAQGLAACTLVAVLAHAWPSRGAPALVWRPARPEGRLGSVPWQLLPVAIELLQGSALIALMLLAGGERMTGTGSPDTQITAFLGLVFAWAVAIGFGYKSLVGACASVCHKLHDPARPARGPVAVDGAPDRAARRRVRSVLEAAGLEPRFEGQREGLPRTDAADVLSDGGSLFERLARKDRVRRRRELKRRLARLFKEAAGRRFERGSGFWIAPHLLFPAHLVRDTDEEEGRTFGPPYWRVLSRAARSHLREVLDALELDLIFVEDGVGHRRFLRVLDLVFEYHDVFGARRLEDERHFAGLPGVRVLVHECLMEATQRQSDYPEPDYAEIGRARVLHVFRDRGGEEEPAVVPGGRDRAPAPALPLQPVG